jgi:hypothetical protein
MYSTEHARSTGGATVTEFDRLPQNWFLLGWAVRCVDPPGPFFCGHGRNASARTAVHTIGGAQVHYSSNRAGWSMMILDPLPVLLEGLPPVVLFFYYFFFFFFLAQVVDGGGDGC